MKKELYNLCILNIKKKNTNKTFAKATYYQDGNIKVYVPHEPISIKQPTAKKPVNSLLNILGWKILKMGILNDQYDGLNSYGETEYGQVQRHLATKTLLRRMEVNR